VTTTTVTTNHHMRPLEALADVPASVAAEFDYITGEDVWTPRLFQYRGEWYDVNEFTVVQNNGELAAAGWHGIQGDSYWTAHVVRYAPDWENVIVGRVVVSG
jgi:hypothetical protein